jgi:hypothetical protein
MKDLESRTQAAIDAVVSTGRPVYELEATTIVMSSSYFNAEIVTRSDTPVTFLIPFGLIPAGAVTTGLVQGGA